MVPGTGCGTGEKFITVCTKLHISAGSSVAQVVKKRKSNGGRIRLITEHGTRLLGQHVFLKALVIGGLAVTWFVWLLLIGGLVVGFTVRTRIRVDGEVCRSMFKLVVDKGIGFFWKNICKKRRNILEIDSLSLSVMLK